MKKFQFATIALALLTACSNSGGATGTRTAPTSANTVKVTVIYGSEKKDWLEPQVVKFNAARLKTVAGTTVVVEATAMGSVESADGILKGDLQPTVWSPASSIYIPVANLEWRKKNTSDLVDGKVNDLVLSPVVIAMWKPMAEALGWPAKQLGWADIARLSTAGKGWDTYGYPEWGAFKFGHTHPFFSNSGVTAMLAMAYAGSGKQRGLTLDDVANPATRKFVESVQSSVIHYGSSTGFFGDRMFDRGPSYLSAAVLYENLIVAQEDKRIKGQSAQLPVVAIYPQEGTFWANNPYAVLNAPWVTKDQRDGAAVFEKFLLDRPQQLAALEFGWRPADPAIGLSAPLDADHGVDTTQPKTVLEVPTADVIQATQSLWKTAKKPVDVTVVLDISGSMQGARIASARQSLQQFIGLLDDRDRLRVVLFSTTAKELSPLTALGPKRDELLRRVGGIIEGGDTRLFDTVLETYKALAKDGDPRNIRALVVLTDGEDNQSNPASKAELTRISDARGGEGGSSIKIFTIAYGTEAPRKALQEIAEPSGGKQYSSNPANIRSIYSEIATFF